MGLPAGDPRLALRSAHDIPHRIARAARAAVAAMIAGACVLATPVDARRLPTLSDATQQRIDALVESAIHAGLLPGAQLVVVSSGGTGSEGTILMRRAYGIRTLEPAALTNDMHTVYEFASVTKAACTADALLLLVQHGSLRLGDRVTRWIPEFGQNGKDGVTIAQMLLHIAGMPIDYDPADYFADRATILQHAYAAPLRFVPGTKFEYSDLAYIVLAEVIARASGMSYEQFVQTQLFAPLDMRDAAFDTTIDARHRALLAPQLVAATDQKLRATFGTVPGLNGHAGMLATADDVAKLAVALLRAEHGIAASAPLSPQTVRAMLEPHFVGNGNVRAYGWDLDSVYSRNRGDIFPRGGFGHTGSSGTSVWIDPAFDVAVIFASNAHYPSDKGTTLSLEANIATVVAGEAELAPGAAAAAREQEARFDAAVSRSALSFPKPP